MEFRTQTVARRLVATLVAMCALTEGVWSAAQTQETGQTATSSRTVLLKEGTEIKLNLRDTITSTTAVEGDLLNLIFDQDLKVGEMTIARGRICRGCNRLSRRQSRDAGQTRRSWPEVGVPEGKRFVCQAARYERQARKGQRGDRGCPYRSFWTHRANQARQER